MREQKDRVRLRDIAADLGLSIMAVSKALRGHADIGRETRQRVIRRAEELGYRPNQLARQLLEGRSRTMGMVVPTLAYSFFAQLAHGVSSVLLARGYQLLLCNSDGDVAREQEQVKSLLAHQVEAVVLASSGALEQESEMGCLRGAGVPYVLAGRGVPHFPANFVGSDGVAIGGLATRHLIQQGYRRIGHIHGPPVAGSVQRRKGYLDALASHRIAVNEGYIAGGRDGVEGGYEAMSALLTRRPRPDAVFCYNDSVAAGAMKAILERRLKIPRDIALAGVGNLAFSDLLRVPLTTVDQYPVAMGEKAARLALDSVTAPGRAAEQIIVAAKLVIRESSARS